MTEDLETCVYKIRSLRSAVPTPQEEKCRTCTKEYEICCDRYLPVSRTELSRRRGIYAEPYLSCILG